MYILAGYGKMTFASDDKYIGYWRDGMRHGKVYNKYITLPKTLYLMLTHTVHLKSYSFTKTVVYVMLQKPLVRCVSPASQGRIVYSNGDFFEGMFKEGQIEGEGALRCRNGLEYKGTWKHSQVLHADITVYSMFTRIHVYCCSF